MVLNLAFLVLYARKNRACWPFGIIGSAFGLALFLSPSVKLYSEAMLYAYYVLVGIYGWWRWGRQRESLKSWPLRNTLVLLLFGLLIWPLLGWYMHAERQANSAFLDAFTTVFSLLASYLQAEKVYTAWHIWIVVNGLSIFLYWQRGLEVYAVLAIVYFSTSVYGFLAWKPKSQA